LYCAEPSSGVLLAPLWLVREPLPPGPAGSSASLPEYPFFPRHIVAPVKAPPPPAPTSQGHRFNWPTEFVSAEKFLPFSSSHKTTSPSYSLWLSSLFGVSMAGLGGETEGQKKSYHSTTYPLARCNSAVGSQRNF
jgi:hypothetical protein